MQRRLADMRLDDRAAGGELVTHRAFAQLGETWMRQRMNANRAKRMLGHRLDPRPIKAKLARN